MEVMHFVLSSYMQKEEEEEKEDKGFPGRSRTRIEKLKISKGRI